MCQSMGHTKLSMHESLDHDKILSRLGKFHPCNVVFPSIERGGERGATWHSGSMVYCRLTGLEINPASGAWFIQNSGSVWDCRSTGQAFNPASGAKSYTNWPKLHQWNITTLCDKNVLSKTLHCVNKTLPIENPHRYCLCVQSVEVICVPSHMPGIVLWSFIIQRHSYL